MLAQRTLRPRTGQNFQDVLCVSSFVTQSFAASFASILASCPVAVFLTPPPAPSL